MANSGFIIFPIVLVRVLVLEKFDYEDEDGNEEDF